MRQPEMSQEQVLDLMQEFVDQCQRLKSLKDDLLQRNFFGHVEEIDRLHDECQAYDETVGQIRSIYSEHLLPMMDRLAAFLAAHPEELRLVAEQEGLEEIVPVN